MRCCRAAYRSLQPRRSRAAGGVGNWDTCLVSPCGGGAEPEGSAETQGTQRGVIREDGGAGGLQGVMQK